LVFFLITTLFLNYIVKSKFGRAWIAIRNNEPAAQASGVNTFMYKTLAFTVSSFLGGLGGALYASFFSFISPNSFTFTQSVFFLSIIAVGGRGTLWCALIGSAALVVIPETWDFVADFEMIFYGLLLIICMMFLPKGLATLLEPFKKLLMKISGKGGAKLEKGGI
ncbi:MAG TPA: branched-chain amino acid ABC transporter permease, partial [Anaerovoracaceae bacterium]|nr:branched-chain amino acid ABC transporter permease [Anaerovoracaceae bacterium]